MDATRNSTISKGRQRCLWALLLMAIAGSAFASVQPAPSPTFDFVPPQAIHNPPPRYPPGSADAAEAGTVVLTLRIEADGTVSKVALDQSSGFPRLDAAAMEAAASWLFSPAQEDGRPVPVKAQIPVRFVAE
ncbi:energy transducer TonB [Stenotrophomonas sp.]|uniref:energy transducer TonB n=1 Tax=Stenotrophomonas sp. TaxID=69392 RepID=UPI00289B6736|nr:energy transducer TonB [Stenotrophomonas sp.]